MTKTTIRPRTLLLAALFALAGVASLAGALDIRVVEMRTSIVGIARGQTAVLNVLDDAATGSTPLYAILALVDGDGKVLAKKTVALERGKVQMLELGRDAIDARTVRVPIRGLVRFYGRRSTVAKPVHVSLELVDDETGQTGAAMFCPSDFQFAGPNMGRGDAFSCPPPACTLDILAP
jgi:hypothetical protein